VFDVMKLQSTTNQYQNLQVTKNNLFSKIFR
jgi:hypothetical protein